MTSTQLKNIPLHRIFFFFTVAFLPTQLGMHFWPAWSFVLGRRVDYLAPTLYVTDILVISTVLLWIISLMLPSGKNWRLNIFRYKQAKVFWVVHHKSIVIWLLFLFFSIANIYFSVSPFVSSFKWLKIIELSIFGIYIVSSRVSKTTIMYGLVIGMFVATLIGISQFALQHSVGGFFWIFGERNFNLATPGVARAWLCHYFPLALLPCRELLRSYATFPHPNVFAGFIVIIFLMIAPLFFSTTKKMSPHGFVRNFVMITGFLMFIALLTTFSRSAWFIACVTGGIYLIVQKDMLHLSLTRTAGLFVFFVLCIAGISFFLINPMEESVVVRQQLNSAAVTMWQERKLFGVGLGNFLIELPNYLPKKEVYFLQPVHNIFLLWFVEVGLVGYIFLLVSFILFRHFIIRLLRVSHTNSGLSVPSLLPIFALVLFGLVDHWPLTLHQGQMLTVIAVCWTLLPKESFI